MGILSALLDRIEQTDALETRVTPRSQPAPDVPLSCTLVLLDPPAQADPAGPCWQVFIDGELICSMVGAPMTQRQADEAAKHRWPTASVLAPASLSSTSTSIHEGAINAAPQGRLGGRSTQ